MPLMDISNPAVILFLTENYEKENRLRLNWITRHQEKIKDAATLSREPTHYYDTDVFKHVMEGGMAASSRDHVNAGYNKRRAPIRDGIFIPGVEHLRKGHSIIDVGLGDAKEDPRLGRPHTDTTYDPLMRPVPKKMTDIIYKSKPEYGRLKYLEKRGKILPEKKYYFPETSYWVYGWRMGDSSLTDEPRRGRCWVLTKALKNRVGPAPDPNHYTAADMPTNTKCEN